MDIDNNRDFLYLAIRGDIFRVPLFAGACAMKPNSILLHDTGAGWELYAVYSNHRELLCSFASELGLYLVRKLVGIITVNYYHGTYEED